MKKQMILVLVLILKITLAHGQASADGLLWKISGNGLESSSYLFGTFHMLCTDQLDITDQVAGPLSETEQLVLELDFDDPAVMPAVQQGMAYTDGTSAKDYLSEDEYALVADFFNNKMQFPFEQMAVVKPFFLSAMTIVYFLDCQPESMEAKLMALAGKNQIEVLGLETVEQQLGFIDAIPLDDQKEILVESVEDPEEMKKMTDEMVSTYLAGDLDGLQRIIDEYMSEDYTQINEDLILKRNKAWIPVIEKMMGEQPTFFAVGAGHLTGEKGVIELLRKEGYTLTLY